MFKVQYEGRISELEDQLAMYRGAAEHAHPHTHALALERELQATRERHRQQVRDLQTQIDTLNAAVASKESNTQGMPGVMDTGLIFCDACCFYSVFANII